MIDKLKYRIADFLNEWFPVCWTDLVRWIEFGNDFPDLKIPQGCINDCVRDGSCFCGKYRIDDDDR